jgi:hypothetical protein
MIRNRWVVGAVALVAGGGIATAVGVLPALGQASPPSSPVIMGSTAQIVAKGAGATPFALVACESGTFTSLSITLTEKSGNGIASGSGGTNVNCNGEIQTISVPVSASGKPFGKGIALGQATLFASGPIFCGQTTVSGNVSLTTKG